MKCRCKAKPAAVVTWYRGTTVVSESEKIAIKSSSTEEDIYELVLEIKVSGERLCLCMHSVRECKNVLFF